jgi:hypothetical protein
MTGLCGRNFEFQKKMSEEVVAEPAPAEAVTVEPTEDETPPPAPTKQTFRKKVVLPSDKDETKVRPVPRPVPKFEETKAQVKLNTAAILREEARVKRLETEEHAKLENKLLALRDASEFNSW